MRIKNLSYVKSVVGYAVLYCLAVAGSLSFDDPFATDIVLLAPVTAALFAVCVALYTIDMGFIVRALQLLTLLVFIVLARAGDRPANEEVAYFCFISIILGMCILTPRSNS